MDNEPDELGVLGKEIDGRYRLERFVGAGTMGAVYEGTQVAVGRRVAIKLLNAALQTKQEVRDRFRVEAQAIAALSHPNCVTLYDFGYSEELGALFMAVEFLDGDSLQELTHRGLQPRAALLLSRQIADVLAVAHAAGIMHRDLKPENVMVVEGADGEMQAKVLDFGLARIFEDATGGARLTRQGQLFGTPAYMSPEQCRSAMEVGPPSDIYALGVSMFEMLMGRLPFESPSVPELLILHSTKTAPPVVTDAEIPLEVSAMIARMMAKSPEDRPTAEDVSAVLSAVLDGQQPPTLPPPASVSGAQEVKATTATLAMTHSDNDASATGVMLGESPRHPPSTAAIAALVLAVLLLVGVIGIAVSTKNSTNGHSPPTAEPLAVAAPEDERDAPPVVEVDIAPEQAQSEAKIAALGLSSVAQSVAEAAVEPVEPQKKPIEALRGAAIKRKRQWKKNEEARREAVEAWKNRPKTRRQGRGKAIDVPKKREKKEANDGFERLTGADM